MNRPGFPHLSRDRFNAWTPGYAAPELLEGQLLSANADVFAVACVIYELAAGKNPFRGLPLAQTRNESLESELRAPENLPKHCWPALRAALAFDVADRTITVKQLRDVFAVTSSWLQRLGHWRKG